MGPLSHSAIMQLLEVVTLVEELFLNLVLKLEAIAQKAIKKGQSSTGQFGSSLESNEEPRSDHTYRKHDRLVDKAISPAQQEMSRIVEEIEKSNQYIPALIEVIELNSSHIRLLALHATHEAIRAGKHGQGFVNVAFEVMKMATRSQNTAIKILRVVANLEKTIRGALKFIEEPSDINLEKLITTKDRISEMAANMKQQNQIIYQALFQATQHREHDTKKLTETIMSIKFENMTQERLATLTQNLKNIRDQLRH